MSTPINPKPLRGPWKSGFALDLHTRSSTFLGNDALGHAQFDTVRSPMGELVYRLKYKNDANALLPIIETVAEFLGTWKPRVELIVPVPPSNSARLRQPVIELAKGISLKVGIPLADSCLAKTKPTGQVKDIDDTAEKAKMLSGAFVVDQKRVAGKHLLLFDDLFDSGSTAGTITKLLLGPGRAAAVHLLTLTQTR